MKQVYRTFTIAIYHPTAYWNHHSLDDRILRITSGRDGRHDGGRILNRNVAITAGGYRSAG